METIEQKLEVLSKIAERFNGADMKWAVGASLLLYLKGYVEQFNDIDLLIYEEDALTAKELMMEIGELQKPKRNSYKAEHFYIFMVDGVKVDIMGNYIVAKDGIDYEVALNKDASVEYIRVHGQTIPLDSILRWRRHYDVMGRQAKVELIDMHNKEI